MREGGIRRPEETVKRKEEEKGGIRRDKSAKTR